MHLRSERQEQKHGVLHAVKKKSCLCFVKGHYLEWVDTVVLTGAYYSVQFTQVNNV